MTCWAGRQSTIYFITDFQSNYGRLRPPNASGLPFTDGVFIYYDFLLKVSSVPIFTDAHLRIVCKGKRPQACKFNGLYFIILNKLGD
jgi:hypothetical protein